MQISQSQPMDAGDFLPSNSSWLRRYFDYAYPICDAPSQFHIANGLSVLSVGCQDLFLVYDEERIRTNLWISLVAPSGICRKSASIFAIQRVLSQLDNHFLYGSLATDKMFVDALKKQCSTTVIWHDLSSRFNGRRELGRLESELLAVYDCPVIWDCTLSSRRSVRIETPFVNIMAATSPNHLGSWLKEGDLKGGLLPRFLWVRADTRTRFIAFPPEPPKALEDELVERLALIRQTFRGEMMLSAEAESMYSEFVSQLQQDVSDLDQKHLWDEFFRHYARNVLKLAMLLAVDNQAATTPKLENLIITTDTIKSAINLVDYLGHGIFRMIQR